MNKLHFITFAIGLATSAAAIAGPVRTHSTPLEVRYDDLNPNSKAGAVILHHRVEAAVASLCGSRDGRETLATQNAVRSCRADAVASTNQKLNEVFAVADREQHVADALAQKQIGVAHKMASAK